MKILLSRTDRIGDLILSTPAIATVRASFPDAHLTMVTSEYNGVAIERNDDVDELVVLEKGMSPQALGSRLRGYDIAVALAPRAVDLKLVGATRAPVRVGYTYERRWVARLTAPLYVNRVMISEADPELCDRDPGRIVRHEVVQLLDLVALAGARARVTALRLDVTQADRNITRDLPRDPIVLHLGRRWFGDGSTLEGTLGIVDRLGRTRAGRDHLCRRLRGTRGRLRAASVGRAAASRPAVSRVGRGAGAGRVVVTVDTGATHVASAVQGPRSWRSNTATSG